MEWYFIVLIVLASFFFMEFMAWFSHKYVMHGFLWVLHQDHHVPTGKSWQKNDIFALMYAAPSIILCVLGSLDGIDYRFWIGIGIALYGIAYFLLHDTLVHERTRILTNIDNNYFRAIVSAHNDHHIGKKNYGFVLMFPWKYFKRENQKNLKRKDW
jgi:beta-carotene 3-hydroxylase